jgi:hypothetical protein
MLLANTLCADVFRCVMLHAFAGLSSSRFLVRYSESDTGNVICMCKVVDPIEGRMSFLRIFQSNIFAKQSNVPNVVVKKLFNFLLILII